MDHTHKKNPTAYIVAGVNGSGKTTFATEFLPEFADCREFLNADLIASGLSPFLPDEQNIRRRFPAGIHNFFHLYRPLLDEWILFDASELPPAVIASEKDGTQDVLLPDLYMQIKQSVEAVEP